MKIVLPSFDPSATTSGTISNPLPGGKGRLIIRNDSGINLIFTFSADQVRVLAQSAELVTLCAAVFTFTWQQETVLLNAANVPISLVLIDAYTPDEPLPGTYPFSIPRVANVGNQVTTTSSNSVIVSGETPPNDLVKSSPIGYTHSTIDIRDDGTITVYGLDNNVEKLLFQIAPSASVAVKIALLSAALGSAGQLTIDESGNLVTTGTASVGNLTMTKIASSDAGAVTTDGAGKLTAAKLSSDSGKVTTDGAGTLTAVTLTASGTVSGAAITSAGAVKGTNMVATSGSFSSSLALGGANQEYLDIAPSDGDRWGLFETTGKSLSLYDFTTGAQPVLFNGDGTIAVGKLIPVNGGSLSGISTFSGTGSGTFSHGLSATPGYVGQCPTVTNSTYSIGCDSIGSSTVHMNIAAGGETWVAAAVK